MTTGAEIENSRLENRTLMSMLKELVLTTNFILEALQRLELLLNKTLKTE